MQYCTNQSVRVKKHALLELRQSPAMQLRKGDAQLRSCQKRQISCIFRVQHVHLVNQIECGGQFDAHRRRHAGRDQHGKLMLSGRRLQGVGDDQGAQRVGVVGGQRNPSKVCVGSNYTIITSNSINMPVYHLKSVEKNQKFYLVYLV